MTIYNFNLGIGWASSGVEYAQAYRAKVFRENKQKAKFIFTDMLYENIQGMTKNIGFRDDEIIWLYQYYTDIKIGPTTYTLSELESYFTSSPSNINKNNNTISYYFSDSNAQINVILTRDGNFISKTETFVNGMLLQRDYYSYVKVFSEYFKPVKGQAHLFQRRFFNENGSIAYDELINGKQSLYLFKNRTIYSFQDLMRDFINGLNLTKNDIVIIDRSTGIGTEILKEKQSAKVGVVIHADHFSEPETNDERILWNNYYEYQFQNASKVDFFITATDSQKELLKSQFIKYKKGDIKIYTIPVGSLEKLRGYNEKRKPNSLITASRLATEKHIDWVIEAVVRARLTINNLTLDIYGEGGEAEMLKKLIVERKAEDYIRLMGQKDLTEIYKRYLTYISGSTSEGFGLTLMEAVGSGLGMIGFDVRYGNPTFIKDGKNGFLVNYESNNVSQNIDQLYQGILNVYSKQSRIDNDYFRDNSYRIAQAYLTSKVKNDWNNLVDEVLND